MLNLYVNNLSFTVTLASTKSFTASISASSLLTKPKLMCNVYGYVAEYTYLYAGPNSDGTISKSSKCIFLSNGYVNPTAEVLASALYKSITLPFFLFIVITLEVVLFSFSPDDFSYNIVASPFAPTAVPTVFPEPSIGDFPFISVNLAFTSSLFTSTAIESFKYFALPLVPVLLPALKSSALPVTKGLVGS